MGKFRLSRRTFLAGIGGAAISLPLLEIMEGPKALAAVDDGGRFILGFAGSSSPRSDLIVPATTGTGYELPRALMPLMPVKDHVSVVTGLKIPWQGMRGSADVPPGGRPASFHASTIGPLLSGARSTHTGDNAGNPRPTAPSADQIVAPCLGDAGLRFRSLEYRVQAAPYRGGASKGRISYERNADGNIIEREPVASPSLAYEQLFTGFVPSDPVEAERRRFLLRQDHSVIDLVADRADRLRSRLGRDDLRRIERHFDELRDLERLLAEIPEPTMACVVPDHPGTDPAESSYPETGRDGRIIGYAQEDQRARVMADLIHMAITCDLARTFSWQITFAQTFMSAQEVLGIGFDFHELGHGAGSMEDMADGFGWHMKHWAYLIERLRDSDELDGTLLDKTALVFLMEGGRGYDPEGNNDTSSHSSENMVVVIGGRPDSLVNGQHIAATDRHPAEVTLTAMRSLGIDDDLGDLTRPIDELLI